MFAQNIDYGYALEPPHRGGSNEYPQSVLWNKIIQSNLPALEEVLLLLITVWPSEVLRMATGRASVGGGGGGGNIPGL